MTVDELQVLITANTNNLRKEIQNVNKQLDGIQKTATKSSSSMVSAVLKGNVATRLLSKGFSLLTSNLDSAVTRLDALNNFPRVMSNLEVSEEDAQASMNRLSDALVGLPTTLDDATMSVQRFTSANGNVKASTEMFLALNNAILSGGASTEIQKSALEQLSQAYAKGKPDMMEWRTAMTAMPAQLRQVAIAMGYVSADQLGEALRNGNVSMNEFMSKIIELNQKGLNGFQSFEEQARNSTGGVATSITNVKTAITRGLAEIMNAIGQSNIAGFFQTIAKVINAVVPYITGFVKACVWAVSSISSLFGNGTKKKVDDTNKSLKSLGSSGATSSKGIDKATGSAKKLKKELSGVASFDKMNILQSNNSSSGDSGTSGGSSGDLSGVDLSGFNTDMKSVSSKADQVAEHLKKVFKIVGNTLSSIWSSAPVQAYVGLLKTQFDFLKNLAIRLGTDLFNNMSITWENIKNNVGIAISNMSLLFTTMWTDMALGVETWGQPIIDGVSGVFNSIWQDAIDPAIQLITQVWADFSGTLVNLWNKHGKPLVNNVGEFVTNIIGLFQKIWDDVLEPIITPFLEQLSWLWEKHIKGMVEQVGDFVGKLVNDALEIYNKFIDPIVKFLLDTLSPAWAYLSSLIIGQLSSVLGFIADFVGNCFEHFGGIIDFLTGIFTGNWKKAWDGVKSIFKSTINSLVSIFKLPINLIIDGINSFLSGLNKIKIPKWVPGVGGKGFSIPKIPKLARGGIVDKPTTAIIGDAGKEAIMPLENNTSWMDDLASKINKSSKGPIQLVVKIGEDTLLNKVIDGINNKNFETNGEVFSI